MDLKQLKEQLERLSEALSVNDRKVLRARVKSLISVFPFNEYEYVLMFLLDKKVITFDEYERLRKDYVSQNRYLELYGLAPRIFGEMWHKHLLEMDSRFQKPNKSLDPDYNGQYDLWIEGVRVEVKASRAINTKKKGNLVEKALRYGKDEPFWMNFQQIKADMADVFVFIGVWLNKIVYWVLSSEEVKQNPYYSPQHRGGIEYQIGITEKNIEEFDIYKVNPKKEKLGDVVIKKGKRHKSTAETNFPLR